MFKNLCIKISSELIMLIIIMGSGKVLIQAYGPNTYWTPWSEMGQTHTLKVRPNSLKNPMKCNKASPSIQEAKGILIDCSYEIGNKIHEAKSYPRKCTRIIHGIPTTGT